MVGGRAGAAGMGRLKMPTLVWVDGFNVPNYEQRDPAPQYQLPLTPQESMRYIQTPAEFKVELFASEPDIVKPISFSFDERGRLWVIEAIDYPNTVLNGAPGNDRIKICEDTNGDGRADKFTIFADHLNVPTSLTFANGGVIVTATPNILFLKDTERRRQGRRAPGAEHRLGHSRHARGAVQPAVRPRQLHLGRRRLLRLQRADERQADAVHPGRLSIQAGRQRLRVRDRLDEQHVGPRILGDVRRVRLDREQRSEFLPGHPEPVFHRHREGCLPRIMGARASGPGYQSAAAFYAVHPTTPYIRQVDVQGGYTAAAGHHLYTARAFPEGVLEPRRVHHRADGPSRRPGDHREPGRGLRDA